MKAARQLDIQVHGTFILGLPGETAETMEQTIRFARDLDPYSIQVSLAAPYPGTELYDQAKQNGWLAGEGDRLVREGIQDSALSYKDLPAERIFDEVDRFYRRFYFRPRPILRILREMLADRDVFHRRIREGREFFSFMARRKEMAKGHDGCGDRIVMPRYDRPGSDLPGRLSRIKIIEECNGRMKE